jgi:hypothetical protein
MFLGMGFTWFPHYFRFARFPTWPRSSNCYCSSRSLSRAYREEKGSLKLIGSVKWVNSFNDGIATIRPPPMSPARAITRQNALHRQNACVSPSLDGTPDTRFLHLRLQGSALESQNLRGPAPARQPLFCKPPENMAAPDWD